MFTGFLKHGGRDKETQIYPSFGVLVATVATVAGTTWIHRLGDRRVVWKIGAGLLQRP